MDNLEQGLNNWNGVGLLDNLTPEGKLDVARLYQDATIYLMTNDYSTEEDFTLELLILPAIRNIYSGGKKNIIASELCVSLSKYITDTQSDYKGYPDPNLELLKDFVKLYLEKK